MADPTNGDIIQAFHDHAAEDHAFQKEQRGKDKESKKRLDSIEVKLDGLATKDDIAELKDFMKNVNVGIGIFKFSWNNAGKLGAFCVLLLGVYLLFKVGFLGAIMWLAKFR